jgi:hypothetical protein
MWSDCVDDLWEKHFPLRGDKIIAGGVPNRYGFQEGNYEDDTIIDELAVSLDRFRDEVEEQREEKLVDAPLPGNVKC